MYQIIANFISWLRAGYPESAPPTDYVPVMALLSREHSPAETSLVASAEVAG